MSMQDPATHVRAREQAAFRYEAARRALASTLDHRLSADTALATREPDRLERRRQAIDRASHMLVPLSRFIKREVRLRTDRGEVEEQLVDPDDVLMSAVVAVLEEYPSKAEATGIYPWLRRTSNRIVRQSALEEAERARTERSLESPIQIAGPDWPDHVQVLREVLADPNAVLPEHVLGDREKWALMEAVLDNLPERWREVFLLRSVDAWDDDEIAKAEGIDVTEVEMINLAARAYLRESMRECELLREAWT